MTFTITGKTIATVKTNILQLGVFSNHAVALYHWPIYRLFQEVLSIIYWLSLVGGFVNCQHLSVPRYQDTLGCRCNLCMGTDSRIADQSS